MDNDTTEEATYYAILSDDGKTVGILRRRYTQPGPVDESFRRDSTWQVDPFLRLYAMGHNDRDYAEISAAEAADTIRRWRAKWAREDKNQ